MCVCVCVCVCVYLCVHVYMYVRMYVVDAAGFPHTMAHGLMGSWIWVCVCVCVCVCSGLAIDVAEYFLADTVHILIPCS